MPATIRQHGPQLRAAEMDRFRAEIALCLAGSQLQVICAYDSSLQKEVGQLQSDRPV